MYIQTPSRLYLSISSITGRIQTRTYENQQGQRVYVMEVVADSFQILKSL